MILPADLDRTDSRRRPSLSRPRTIGSGAGLVTARLSIVNAASGLSGPASSRPTAPRSDEIFSGHKLVGYNGCLLPRAAMSIMRPKNGRDKDRVAGRHDRSPGEARPSRFVSAATGRRTRRHEGQTYYDGKLTPHFDVRFETHEALARRRGIITPERTKRHSRRLKPAFCKRLTSVGSPGNCTARMA